MMSTVVAVHGIGQTYEGADTLSNPWLQAMNTGLVEAGFGRLEPQNFAMVGYGSLFRRSGTKAGALPPLTAKDVTEDFERELLTLLWREAARLSAEARRHPGPDAEDPTIQSPDFEGKARTPKSVQAALMQVSKSRYFKAFGGQRVLIFGLRQVRRYLDDESLRSKVLDRLAAAVQPGTTRVLVGHSLGSVVAYEALCVHLDWQVDTLVTLGSPLGIRNLIFERLRPEPGAWPNVRRWVNVADNGDIVALDKELAPLFGEGVDDRLVYNGWRSHDIARYLTAAETGDAIGEGLRG
jgi:hypothetical protein